jgi:hypothetical protein
MVAVALEELPSRQNKQSLLRIHEHRFAVRDSKGLAIKQIGIFECGSVPARRSKHV